MSLINGMDDVIAYIKKIEDENNKMKNGLDYIYKIFTTPSSKPYTTKIKEVKDIIQDTNSVIDYKKLYEEQQKENEKLKEENLNLQKQNNTRKDIIYNLFAKMIKMSNIDDGIDIIIEYGNKYIDEWLNMHKEIYQDVVETMNSCELHDDCIHLEYDDYLHFDFCMDEESDDEETDDE